MVNNKIIGKKTFCIALAAAALAAGAANARDARPPAPAPIGNAQLLVSNQSGGCIRLYFNGKQYDYQNGAEQQLAGAKPGVTYLASVFKGAKCGGVARHTSKFTFPQARLGIFYVW